MNNFDVVISCALTIQHTIDNAKYIAAALFNIFQRPTPHQCLIGFYYKAITTIE